MLNKSYIELNQELNRIEDKSAEENIHIAIVYHAHCNDGIVSAAVVLDYILTNLRNYTYTLLPYSYGEDVDNTLIEDKFDVLFVVDFSFSGPILEVLCTEIPSVFVFDHHKTPIEALTEHFSKKKMPANLFMNLTQDRGVSGANLCWKILCLGKPVPELVLDVADRDTWLFERPNSKRTHRGLLLMEDNREPHFVYEMFISRDRNISDYQNLVSEGKAAQAMWDFTLREISETTFSTTIKDSEGIEVKCWVTNCPYMFVSDLSTVIMSSKGFNNKKDICCMIVVREHDVKLSFRSKNKRAKEFAEMLGGGGHPDAAGAENLNIKRLEEIFSCF